MVEEKYREVLDRVLELTDTACQASLELLGHIGNPDTALMLLEDLRSVVQAVRSTDLASRLEHSFAAEMLENVEDTLYDIARSIETENVGRAAMKTEFQLFPFLRQLKEAFYFWGMVYPDQEKMNAYYQHEFAEHYRNYYVCGEETAPFRLSIFVTGYNHLETTRQCIEQLLKETDFQALNAELILIDHGSTDGTLAYFESLGVEKVIHFKRNVRMYMFSFLAQVCQSEFFCFVSNDILVTRNWAKILLNCLESDARIIAAVPATPNISNYQALRVPDRNPKEFLHWANRQNHSDPSHWNDRARLMPPLGMYQTAAVSRIGFADPYFYSMEFWDDDFSLRARRAGYRQIHCEDVACYHFGSVTGREGQQKENTLVYGQDLFREKNGVDAWGAGFCYDYQTVRLLTRNLSISGDAVLLGLDCGMGDTPLQIQNELRRERRGCQIYQLTSQEKYLPDLRPHSKEAYFSPQMIEGIQTRFASVYFTCACLGQDIGYYEDCGQMLAEIARRLVPGGCLVFSCANPFYAPTLHAILAFSLPEGRERLELADPEQICRTAKKYFSSIQVEAVEQTVNGLEQFAKRLYGNVKRLPQIMKQLGIQQYYFICKK